MWKYLGIQSMLLVSTLAFSQQVVPVDLNRTIHQMTSPTSNCNSLSGGAKMPLKDPFFIQILIN